MFVKLMDIYSTKPSIYTVDLNLFEDIETFLEDGRLPSVKLNGAVYTVALTHNVHLFLNESLEEILNKFPGRLETEGPEKDFRRALWLLFEDKVNEFIQSRKANETQIQSSDSTT